MGTILMSIKPEYVNKIFLGKKKYEYRKKICKEKIDKIIVYSSSPIQMVVGELLIDSILYNKKEIIWNETKEYGGISKDKFNKYFENSNYAVAYKIKQVIIYDNPKQLIDFNIKTAPQSYVYIK